MFCGDVKNLIKSLTVSINIKSLKIQNQNQVNQNLNCAVFVWEGLTVYTCGGSLFCTVYDKRYSLFSFFINLRV